MEAPFPSLPFPPVPQTPSQLSLSRPLTPYAEDVSLPELLGGLLGRVQSTCGGRLLSDGTRRRVGSTGFYFLQKVHIEYRVLPLPQPSMGVPIIRPCNKTTQLSCEMVCGSGRNTHIVIEDP